MDTIIRAALVADHARPLARVARVAASTGQVAVPALPAVPDVHAEAAQILDAARLDAQQLAMAIHEEARERGYAQGLQDGATAGRAAFDAEVARLGAIIAAVTAAKAAVLAGAEDAMVDLAFGALCAILGEQAATRAAVARLVAEHGAARANREQVIVRLHPEDLALLLAGGGDDAALFTRTCRADADIVLGGCMVDSGSGTLDARLETQLARLRATLLAVRAERTGEAPQ
jgi:flagellar assembly protein FliH